VAIVVSVPVREEEELLREKFGKACRDYAEQTGQLIPRIWGQH
jgi:protein-S-isoprenylcysteine O-methyltransferase Ste14